MMQHLIYSKIVNNYGGNKHRCLRKEVHYAFLSIKCATVAAFQEKQMAAKEDLICQMAAQVMTKIMTNSPSQNKLYAQTAVEVAVVIYDLVQTQVQAIEEKPNV